MTETESTTTATEEQKLGSDKTHIQEFEESGAPGYNKPCGITRESINNNKEDTMENHKQITGDKKNLVGGRISSENHTQTRSREK